LTLAITLLLLQLGGAWHSAWRDHARCAEHGEWVDVDRAETSASAVQPSHGPQVEAAGSSSRTHDHCTILEASRVRGITWDGGLAASPAKPVFRPWLTPAVEPIQVGFELYLLAPKHSPPC